ncbi:DUF4302 domain-containing protein [Sphingobacterium phlebotomi]|uniref:DUF4302 domain-containing protein n=1 Tax=Sphingobacterium phlebotomi TaxID=2605433 RepID=A0A5D4HCH0_9SPHI|nr:DUF4302 domain-containing protein [Sphingobacterium phlebotomi]TYR38052.1 DUF4302 domain-containing protein [Sphingobacterium phlebotomi]
MKLKYIIFTFLLPALLMTSCKREEDRIFEENASLRMTEAIANAYGVLQGNEAGWEMKYYPSQNQEFGGYTIFAKFISNAQVTVASDAIENSQTSSYAVIHESGPVLTFNGYNKSIHWYTEPGMDNGGIGADDTGMKGDFEFIVLKATADSVVLKSKKSGTEVVMLPLNANEFEQKAEAYQEAAAQFSQFGVFKLEDASGDLLDIPYSSPIRIFRNPKDDSGKQMSFRVIPSGLEFYAEQEMEGVRFKTLKYVEPTAAYPYGYYTNDNTTFKIVPDVTPLNLWFTQNLWSMSYSNIGPLTASYWDVARGKLAAANFTMSNLYVGNVSLVASGFGGGVLFALNDWVAVGAGSYTITPVQGTIDEVRFTFLGGYGLNAGFTGTHYNAGPTDILVPFNGRTFKITSEEGLEKPSIIMLTDNQLPDNFMRVFLEEINDPLNN